MSETLSDSQDQANNEAWVSNLKGPDGKTIFNNVYGVFVYKTRHSLGDEWRSVLDALLPVKDERAIALVGGIAVESAIDSILSTVFIGYDAIDDNKEFTFSMKITILRSLGLIPNKYTETADCIRHIRNTFAHKMTIGTFSDLDTGVIQGMRDQLLKLIDRKVSSPPPTDPIKLYIRLVEFTHSGIMAYRRNVVEMFEFVRSPTFLPTLLHYFDSKNPGLVESLANKDWSEKNEEGI